MFLTFIQFLVNLYIYIEIDAKSISHLKLAIDYRIKLCFHIKIAIYYG